jgi:hypothetical protein
MTRQNQAQVPALGEQGQLRFIIQTAIPPNAPVENTPTVEDIPMVEDEADFSEDPAPDYQHELSESDSETDEDTEE